MSKVIVIEYVTLDGVVEDPDGRGGTPFGGWLFRFGPEAVAGDKFKLGEVFDTGVMLLGRHTWQLFSTLWPLRDDDFSQRMNAIPKIVASRSLEHVKDWENSSLLEGDLVAEVSRLKQGQDVVVTGSGSVVEVLRANDLIDQYRLIVLPTVLGQGRRLFDHPGPSADWSLVSVEQVGASFRVVYDRLRAE